MQVIGEEGMSADEFAPAAVAVTVEEPGDPSRLEDELTAMLMRYLTG